MLGGKSRHALSHSTIRVFWPQGLESVDGSHSEARGHRLALGRPGLSILVAITISGQLAPIFSLHLDRKIECFGAEGPEALMRRSASPRPFGLGQAAALRAWALWRWSLSYGLPSRHIAYKTPASLRASAITATCLPRRFSTSCDHTTIGESL